MAEPITVPPPLADVFSLRGKRALVTGGTAGLGKAMTLALAEAGAAIVSIELSNDPDADSLHSSIERLGRHCRVIELDVSDTLTLHPSMESLFENQPIRQPDDDIDILLNCAGIQTRRTAQNLTESDMDTHLNVNLNAGLVTCEEFGRYCIKNRRPGKIINIASIVSVITSTNVAAYATSKGGVLHMTRAFSSDYAQHGIQVNCILPGYRKPEVTTQYDDDREYAGFKDYIMGQCPVGRLGDPSDLSGAVVFLASKASDYINGQAIVVDGGFLSA